MFMCIHTHTWTKCIHPRVQSVIHVSHAGGWALLELGALPPLYIKAQLPLPPLFFTHRDRNDLLPTFPCNEVITPQRQVMVEGLAVVEMRGEGECVCALAETWRFTYIGSKYTQEGNEGVLTHERQLMHHSPLTSHFHQNPSMLEHFSFNMLSFKLTV